MHILKHFVYEMTTNMAPRLYQRHDGIDLNLSGYYYLVHSKFVKLLEMHCLSVEYQEL